MEKLQIKGSVILWTIGSQRWLINYSELTCTFITGKHPHTKKALTPALLTKVLNIIKVISGEWWLPKLNRIKNYRTVPVTTLRTLKDRGKKLGSGKYATVYLHKGLAVKVIGHRFYKHLPRLDGKLESDVMELLRDQLVYSYSCPNIITMYQYTPDKKVDYIVLEKLDQTFWSFLQNEPSNRIVKGVILQVLFMLLITQYKFPGFRHNDLKVDNVLLDKTPRTQKITFRFKNYFWVLPQDIPLAKVADFDYAHVPGVIDNPKVKTDHSRSFGCTPDSSKVYDVHLFLNSLYSYRKKLCGSTVKWLQAEIPPSLRGNENSGVKYGRLKSPEDWEGVLKTPLTLLTSRFLSDFRTVKPTYPLWGLKN